jgi:hypothetical protein
MTYMNVASFFSACQVVMYARATWIVKMLCVGLAWGSISSCSLFRPACPERALPASLGGAVNSTKDETMPFVVNGYVLFSSNRPTKNKPTAFNTEFDALLIRTANGVNTVLDAGRALPKFTVPADGAMSSYYDSGTGFLEVYGSAFLAGKAGSNADIFVITNEDGKFSSPVPVAGINTRGWEAHPAISADGTLLIFSSDRAGGFGGADLYMSERQDDGTWSTPVNIGEKVNSKYDDMAAAFSADNSFYYTTKRFSKGRQFDIAFVKISDESWEEPVLMDAPVNSTYDDMYPAVKNDTLYYSSNRPGGCGGFDLYAFPLCAQVRVRGMVASVYEEQSAGTILVLDSKGEEYATIPIDEKKGFDMLLPSRGEYTLRYQNACYRGVAIEQTVNTPCSSSPVVLRVNFDVSAMLAQVPNSALQSEEFTMPFFTTAQFIPPSEEAIGDLQLKQAYNIVIGKAKEIPNDAETMRYAKQIESVVKRIVQTTKNMTGSPGASECDSPIQQKAVEVLVEGYTDARPFAPTATYQGELIADEEFDMSAKPGQKMTNELLSQLRAYYAAKMVRSAIQRDMADAPILQAIRFTAVGKGAVVQSVPANAGANAALRKKQKQAKPDPTQPKIVPQANDAHRKIIVTVRQLGGN